jgi:hypothetical protein
MPPTRTRVRSDYPGPTAPPRTDAFVGLLILSLVAQLVGAMFLYLDFSEYPTTKPPKPAPPAAVAAQTPPPAPAPAPVAPGAPSTAK